MSIAIIAPQHDVSDWVSALQSHAPDVQVEVWPEIRAPEEVELAVCWDHPAGALQQLPHLKCISSLGAGVNHLLNDPTRPAGIPLVRLVNHDLKQSMAEYVMAGVLEHFRQLGAYRMQQARGEWSRITLPHISELGIGIMGYGELGRYVADRLSAFGFKVFSWRRSHHTNDPATVHAGTQGLATFLSKAHILVCLLPLTDATENILDALAFNELPQGAYLINVARGAHLVEDDLLAALETGQLSGALLDVFREEPLPLAHPFWRHAKISLTPHIASITNPASAVRQLVENYRRLRNNESLLNRVDESNGY